MVTDLDDTGGKAVVDEIGKAGGAEAIFIRTSAWRRAGPM